MDEELIVRPAGERDLPAIEAIQSTSPEAAQWAAPDYLAHDCRVAARRGAVTGFIALRQVAGNEWEILNLAVAVASRRCGVAGALLTDILAGRRGAFFLEVRASNTPARRFYETHGFEAVGERQQYYSNPAEPAIVMKLRS